MSLRLILAATTALTLASPAFAQDAVSAPLPVAALEQDKSPDILAFEARSEAFGARLGQFQAELEAAVVAAGGDQAKGMAEVEIILTRYKPEIDAFLPEVEAYYDRQIAAAVDDAQRESLTVSRTASSEGLRGIADHVRMVAPEFITATAPAPATALAPS